MFLQLILVLVVLIPLLAIVLDSQVGRALASRLERRGLDAPTDAAAERIAYLESEVERLAAEVERLDEESEFVHRLLTERSGATGSPRGERSAPETSSSLDMGPERDEGSTGDASTPGDQGSLPEGDGSS